ncbi:MAG TPA: Ig-like domain-containing protein [Vicinamibacterales bacterium]|nr:Ig-like domain-containing protein [Vicinamibacterales bacterium]
MEPSARRFIALICLAVVFVGCEKNPSPTTPSAPTEGTATSLTISGADWLRTGQSQAYTATVNLSDGTTRQVSSAVWTSDNPSVLGITSAGVAQGLTQGSATITATALSVSGTHAVRVWQDYQGTWSGSYRASVCQLRGGFPGGPLCDTTFSPGSLLPISIALTQNAESASGSLALGGFVNALSGSIVDSGRFVGAASGGIFSNAGLTIRTTVSTLDVMSTATDLNGALIFTITYDGTPGDLYVEADLSGVTRTASAARLEKHSSQLSWPAILRDRGR